MSVRQKKSWWFFVSLISLNLVTLMVLFASWKQRSKASDSLTESQQIVCKNSIVEHLYTPKTAQFDNLITSEMDSLMTVLIQQTYQPLAVQIESWKKTNNLLYLTVGSVTMTNFYGVDITRRFVCVGTKTEAEAFLDETNLYLY